MISLLSGIGAFFADQILKQKVEKGELSDGDRFFGGMVSIKKTKNKGFLLNKLENKPQWVIAITSAVFGILAFLYLSTLGKRHRKLKRWGLAIALGGAASNLYDRLKKEGVTDYAEVKGIKGIVMNLGDIFIAVGICISFIGELLGKDD